MVWRGWGGGEGELGSNFAGYVLLASQSPYPITVYSVAYCRLVTFGQICYFCDPNLVAFHLHMYLIFNKKHFTFPPSTTIHVRLLTVNMKHCFTPRKNQKMCDTILVTLLKMLPRDSKFSHENAIPPPAHLHYPHKKGSAPLPDRGQRVIRSHQIIGL